MPWLTHYEVCVCIYICVCVHIYMHPYIYPSLVFCFVLYFETESHFVALAGLELYRPGWPRTLRSSWLCLSKELGLKKNEPPCPAFPNFLIDYFKPFVIWYSFAAEGLVLGGFFGGWGFLIWRERVFFGLLFVAHGHPVLQLWGLGIDFCRHWLADELMTVKVLKGLTIFQNIFLQNPCEMTVRLSYSVKLVIVDPQAPPL